MKGGFGKEFYRKGNSVKRFVCTAVAAIQLRMRFEFSGGRTVPTKGLFKENAPFIFLI